MKQGSVLFPDALMTQWMKLVIILRVQKTGHEINICRCCGDWVKDKKQLGER
jgi:hypothetical protein